MFPRFRVIVLASVVVFVPCAALAQRPSMIEPNGAAHAANANGVYAALRSSLPLGDGVVVNDLTIERQGGKFKFAQGKFVFYGPVNGKVTGAVFLGSGRFELSPKNLREQHSLSLLTKSGVMSQDFTTLVLRFSDGTAEEIRKSSTGAAGQATSQIVQVASEAAKGFRQKLRKNIELRLLEDVLSEQAGQFFLASFRMGGAFTGRNVLFVVDPEGTLNAAPDEVELSTWDDYGAQTWAAYRMDGKEADRGVPIHVSAEKLDVRIEKSGEMKSSAQTTLTSQRDGVRVVELNLYPTLRVSGVYCETGEPLDFIQENKEYDAQFAVVLPKALKNGETTRLLMTYGGKDAVTHDGDGMYTLNPAARESWYPAGPEMLGGFADFSMTFHIPKGLQIIATGKQVSQEAEPGGQRVVWATDSLIPVAGFNLGLFKSREEKTPQGFSVLAFANTELPDSMASLAGGAAMGSMTTTSALENETSQGSAAIQVYSDYFGKLPYDHVALTEQSACNFGQSWPTLVYLPICAFWDSTIKNQLGLLNGAGASYWKEVTPHEVAHQWWGQEVGFRSYRDQWMSEGFASFSVSLYLMATNKNLNEAQDFWKEQRANLLQRNAYGARPIDVGPLTMGTRVSNDKTGNVYQYLIYSKGAYVMHMLQLMYWTPQAGEGPFKHAMQTFVSEYKGKSATTEDLQASLERTMPTWMNMRGDGKLDWFFNEYVYGTELPHYEVSGDFTTSPEGETSMHFKVSQSNVSKDFVMIVPLYLEMANGRTVRILNLALRGDMVTDRTVNLGKLPAAAKRVVLNYNDDVLSD